VSVGDAVSVGVSVGVSLGVGVPVDVSAGDCVGVRVGVGVAVDAGDGVRVVVGVALAVGVEVVTTAGVAVSVAAVGVGEAVGGGPSAHGAYPRKRAEMRCFPASVTAITRTAANLAMRYRVLFPCPAAMSHTGTTTLSSRVRRANAARTALLLDTPGRPCAQSPTESR
jgi:hypothetical protein